MRDPVMCAGKCTTKTKLPDYNVSTRQPALRLPHALSCSSCTSATAKTLASGTLGEMLSRDVLLRNMS